MINNGMQTPKPNFLIIGAQKCGTTWLHQHLQIHPDIFMPAEKELEFFSYRDHLDNPGFSAYLEHFKQAGTTPAVGEATASYFWTRTNSRWSELPDGFQTDIPKTVRQHLGGKLKLIVTLRNPVQRTVSAWLHYLAMGEIAADMAFEQAVAYGGMVDMGFYARHLHNWLNYYPLSQIKVLVLESDIQARPIKTLAAVCRFLSIPEHDFDEENTRQTAFGGPQRVFNKDGVFVTSNGPIDSQGMGWKKDDEGQLWRQLITADRLRQLKEIFLGDVQDLDELLGTNLVQSWEINT